MSAKFRIHEYASFADCARWLAECGESVTIGISAQSSLAPLTEGVALGILHAMAQRTSILVESAGSFEDLTSGRVPILGTAFGVALALRAKSVRCTDTAEAHAKLASVLWQRLLDNRGVVGKGDRTGLLFRDPDYWIPHCLRSGSLGFPLRDQFRATLLATLKTHGFQRSQYSRTEDEIVTFLFETAQNVHQHARLDTSGRAISGVRGILVEKIVLAKDPAKLLMRRDLNPLIREYVQGVWHSISPRSRLLYAMTVADLGPGIHNTMPTIDGESDWERLNRAFQEGQTSKTKNNMEDGKGLAKVRSSAERLNAMLFVRSANLLGFCDFSSNSVKSNRTLLRPWPEVVNVGSTGTSITMIWPELLAGGDQYSLFDE